MSLFLDVFGNGRIYERLIKSACVVVMQCFGCLSTFLFSITGGSVLETFKTTSNLAPRHCPSELKCATHLTTATYVHKGWRRGLRVKSKGMKPWQNIQRRKGEEEEGKKDKEENAADSYLQLLQVTKFIFSCFAIKKIQITP